MAGRPTTAQRITPPPATVESQPCVLHGTWLPGEAAGSFVFWAEALRATPRRGKSDHPFQLRGPDLAVALGSARVPGPSRKPAEVPARGERVWLALPGDGSRPAPSLDMQAESEDESNDANSWGVWRVHALAAEHPLDVLASVQRDAADESGIRIGQDLQFWQRLAARLGRAVRAHEYLPSIRARAVEGKTAKPRSPKRRTKKAAGPRFRFEACWEWADSVEADIVEPFARSMPGACRTVWREQPETPERGIPMRDARALVRHFLDAQLQDAVRSTPFPQSALRPVEDTLVAAGLAGEPQPSAQAPAASPLTERVWMQWRRWRDRIQRGSRDVDETICLRLTDAAEDSPEAWFLEWLLGSRRDPSTLVPLRDFWARGQSRRPEPKRVREVLLQLGQAARIYGRLWQGMRSDAPDGVELTRDEALAFLHEQAPILQGAGFRVIVPAWWTATGQRRLRLRLKTRGVRGSDSAGSESSGMLGFDTLVDFQAQVVLDGKPLTKAEWASLVQAKQGLVNVRGQWMELQDSEIDRLQEFWDGEEELRAMTLADLVRAEAEAGRTGDEIVHQDGAGQLLRGLWGSDGLEQLEQPRGFVGQLREYQLRGHSWLSYLERLGLGACLADDMGLGKTVQVIATVLADRLRNRDADPTLLVAPTSVLGNWQRETHRFAPELATCIHHGPQRAKSAKELSEAVAGADLVIASFGVVRRDAAFLRRMRWRRLVVDESQNIKNPSAAVTKAIRGIKAGRRIALTGTPVENRLMDLWSLFSFLNPGLLGNMTEFRKTTERPIMQRNDREAADRLRGTVRPFILRRMKSDKAIIKDLPDKVEQNSYCNLTPEQASLYEAVVRDLEEQIESSEGIQRQGLILSTLMRLKQICNHPAQFLQDGGAFTESRSHKLARVCEMLDEIEAEDESALVFTQFAEIGKSLERLFRQRYGGAVYYLHGGTPRALREHMVTEFQNPDTDRAIFVLSLRAGGTGITLTRANHVLHFDRWWNPAVENQATDRAYRIGQEKRVFVHKMVTMGTVEERIDAMIESKKKLAEDIVGSDESWLASLDNEAFRKLISLDRDEAVVG